MSEAEFQEKKKAEYIEKELGLTIKQEIQEREKSWFWTLLLLVIGLVLQAIATLDIARARSTHMRAHMGFTVRACISA